MTDVDVLMVEDNEADVILALRAIRDEILTERIYVARDGEEALDFVMSRGAFSQHTSLPQLRLVLLDLKLPKVSGFDVLAEIKKHPRLKITPVVMLSSSKQERDIRKSYELGANGYVQKPVEFEEFRQVIGQVASYWLHLNQAPCFGTEQRS